MDASCNAVMAVGMAVGWAFAVTLYSAAAETASGNAPAVTVEGKTYDIPTVFPDGTTRFHVIPAGAPADHERIPVPAGGHVVAKPVFEAKPDAPVPARWRDVVGTTRLEAGKLIADSPRNDVVIDGVKERDVRVHVDAEASVQMGLLVRYRDKDNFVLAFYQPRDKILGFHEVTDGNFGPQINNVSTDHLVGKTVRMVVEICGKEATATLTDEGSHSASSRFAVGRLTAAGGVGLYHDRSVGNAPQHFGNLRIARLERVVPAGAIQVIVPASLVETDSIWSVGEFIKVTGREGTWPSVGGALRTITVFTLADVVTVSTGPSDRTLFPTRLPRKAWVRFGAEGFAEPACGVVYRTDDTVTNGMPLGGVDTGCLDLETTGLLGYCTLFNTHVPRRGPLNVPILGLSVGGRTWVLCKPEPKDGHGQYQHSAGGRKYRLWRDKAWTDKTKPITPIPMTLELGGAETARGVHYWGHYPVADVEFDTDAPIRVGLRAWSPFLPGDVQSSTLPGAIFEVHLRNPTDAAQQGTIALSFPGPLAKEAGATTFARETLEGDLAGVMVQAPLASYVLGVIGREAVRLGGELVGEGWVKIASTLPTAKDDHPGASVAVDFALPAGKSKVVRFVLNWHAPTWNAGGYNWAGAEHTFTHMYAKHYRGARQAAELLARDHESLLRRVLAWQQVLYAEPSQPVWLRDSLVNVLHLIAEDGLWAQARPPVPEWVRPEDGLFGLNECPRGCPQIECIPCSFYGNQPIVYFFPQLALSTLRGYKGYQYPDGAAVWIFGGCTGQTPPIDVANPTRGYQFATNGISLAAMVDRYFLCYGRDDKDFVREFHPQIKQNMIYTVNLRPAYPIGDRIIAMPTGNEGTEWFEAPEPGWRGMTAHVGGLHLAQLRIAERLATAAGDHEFAKQCAEWIKAGAESMEAKLWAGTYYLNFYEPETKTRSDLVFGYQLDGEWVTDHHGLPSALPEPRVKTVLETIKRFNVALSRYGAVNYTTPDGKPAGVGGYGTYSFFPPEALMLAMTYAYNGQRAFGLELARKVWHNIVCLQGYTWDMPNIMRGDSDTGERTFGNDYYQDMMLWSLPAAVEGKDFGAPARAGGLVDRIRRAAEGNHPEQRRQ